MNLKIYFIIIVFVLIFFTCANPFSSTENSNAVRVDGIEYYIKTDNREYYLGQTVTIQFRVINYKDERVYFTAPFGTEVPYFGVKKGKTLIWYTPRDIDWGFTDFSLAPREKKIFSINWRMDTFGSSEEVILGKYTVIAGLSGYTPSESAPSVTIKVTPPK